MIMMSILRPIMASLAAPPTQDQRLSTQRVENGLTGRTSPCPCRSTLRGPQLDALMFSETLLLLNKALKRERSRPVPSWYNQYTLTLVRHLCMAPQVRRESTSTLSWRTKRRRSSWTGLTEKRRLKGRTKTERLESSGRRTKCGLIQCTEIRRTKLPSAEKTRI